MAVESEFDSNYRYVLVAARRARQLQQGSEPMVSTRATKPQKIAQEEIRAGLVGFVRGAACNPHGIDSNAAPRFASR